MADLRSLPLLDLQQSFGDRIGAFLYNACRGKVHALYPHHLLCLFVNLYPRHTLNYSMTCTLATHTMVCYKGRHDQGYITRCSQTLRATVHLEFASQLHCVVAFLRSTEIFKGNEGSHLPSRPECCVSSSLPFWNLILISHNLTHTCILHIQIQHKLFNDGNMQSNISLHKCHRLVFKADMLHGGERSIRRQWSAAGPPSPSRWRTPSSPAAPWSPPATCCACWPPTCSLVWRRMPRCALYPRQVVHYTAQCPSVPYALKR